MRMRVPLGAALAAMALLAGGLPARAAQPVPVVAGESVYGGIATQIGGADVRVTSILSSPTGDPHVFEASPATARAVAGAAIVVENGAGYDPWLASLLSASAPAGRDRLVVAGIAHRSDRDNPHLWYDPAAVAAFAGALAAALERHDAAHAAGYRARLQAFVASLAPLHAKMAAMRQRFAGVAVTATEPVFGYMADALGLVMRNARFQRAVMNGTEPAASDVAAFEDDLRQHRVRVLIYNTQATDDEARHLLAVARRAGVPVVGVSETEPPGQTYQGWMERQLDRLAEALARPAS